MQKKNGTKKINISFCRLYFSIVIVKLSIVKKNNG